jgi:probable HAF family extracellular repeat protein
MTRSIPARRLFAASLAALFAPALWALPTQYHVTPLGDHIVGEHLNASGSVAVIDESNGKGTFLPAIWSNGVVTRLQDPDARGSAFDVNDGGIAVGDVSGHGFSHAAMWTAANQLVDLGGLFQSDNSHILGINTAGDCAMIAVIDDNGQTGQRSFFARGCTNPQNIGQIGGNYTFVTGLNASGQLAGYSQVSVTSTDQRAYLWTNGTMQLLGVCRNDTSSGSLGLNDSGHVVGFCSANNSQQFSGFYYDGTQMIKIGTLGGTQSEAFAINNADVIVGRSQTSAGIWHAFVLDRGAVPHPLHDLQTMLDASGAGWVFDKAIDINASGVILAHGTLNGQKNHYAILTPDD